MDFCRGSWSRWGHAWLEHVFDRLLNKQTEDGDGSGLDRDDGRGGKKRRWVWLISCG